MIRNEKKLKNRNLRLLSLKSRRREGRKKISASNEKNSAHHRAQIFLANVCHELRTPLNGILGMAQSLHKSELTSEQNETVYDILHSGKTLMTLINDLLHFSKIESGHITIEQAEFNLRDTLAHALDMVRLQAQKKNLKLSFYIAADVPEVVCGDSLRIQQIILNFLNNAIKFTNTGEVKLMVRCAPASHSSLKRINLAVSDTGIGISPANIKKLFRPFTQAETSTTKNFGGHGLGLAISKQLAKLMGGDIRLESLPGVGSTFSFYFDAPAEIPKAKMNRVRHPSELRVLVAEANATNQKVIQKFLEAIGVPPEFANDGLDVVTKASEKPYDLILMDLQMPILSGIDATAAIRKQPGPNSQTWIVAMTANGFEEDRKKCFDAGMDEFISKPIRAGRLEQLIVNFLSAAFIHKLKRAS